MKASEAHDLTMESVHAKETLRKKIVQNIVFEILKKINQEATLGYFYCQYQDDEFFYDSTKNDVKSELQNLGYNVSSSNVDTLRIDWGK